MQPNVPGSVYRKRARSRGAHRPHRAPPPGTPRQHYHKRYLTRSFPDHERGAAQFSGSHPNVGDSCHVLSPELISDVLCGSDAFQLNSSARSQAVARPATAYRRT
eukprot:6752239-Prymnesium_polylepis.1